MNGIRTRTIDTFKAKLLERRGRKQGSKMSHANVNKHLRHLKAALRKGPHVWDFLPKLPQITFLDEPEKLPVYMTPEDFDATYKACEYATLPAALPYPTSDWWRAIMVLGIMGGLRISEMLNLPWDDVHLDEGNLVVRHNQAKGRRDDVIPLHPVVIEHLRRITDYGTKVFDWPLRREVLWKEWGRIQKKGGVNRSCTEEHVHSPRCHVYGFHALKKACGTLNAKRLPKSVLNAFMRHRAFATTEKYYLNHDKLVEGVTDTMFVPKSAQTAKEEAPGEA